MTENNATERNIEEVKEEILKLAEPIEFHKGTYKQLFEVDSMQDKIPANVNAPCDTPMGEQMLDILNNFDKDTWSSTNKGVKTGFPMLDKAFQNGMPSGFYIIAGDSNVG